MQFVTAFVRKTNTKETTKVLKWSESNHITDIKNKKTTNLETLIESNTNRVLDLKERMYLTGGTK